MVDVGAATSGITLTVNSLKTPINRQLLSEWTKNEDRAYSTLQMRPILDIKTHPLTVKGSGQIYRANADGRKLKELYELQTKRTSNRKNTPGTKRALPSDGAINSPQTHENLECVCAQPQCQDVGGGHRRDHGEKGTGPRSERTSPPPGVIDGACGHKISENTVELSSAIHHPGLIDVYRTLRPPTTEYIFSSGIGRDKHPGS